MKEKKDSAPFSAFELSVLRYYAVVCLMAGAVLFFKKLPFQNKPPEAAAKEKLVLRDRPLTERELAYVYAVIHNHPYKWLADNLHISESSVKKGMTALFKKFDVETHSQFHSFLLARDVIFPDEFTAFPE